MEAIGKLLESLGFAAPLLYAGAAYGLFHWLDENLSDDAKVALAGTMKLKDYRKEQVAYALVEVFDRIYTRPLLSWRAFARSLLFTVVVSAIFAFEVVRTSPVPFNLEGLALLSGLLSFNVCTDYVALFVIRQSLTWSGARAVAGLMLAAISGSVIVLLANELRTLSTLIYVDVRMGQPLPWTFFLRYYLLTRSFSATWYMLAAIIVFSWAPLFALGILTIRALTPLSWIVAKAQWALKEGDKHPLKAIGCVAAVAVFAVTVGLRVIAGGASTEAHKGAAGWTGHAASVVASDHEIRHGSSVR